MKPQESKCNDKQTQRKKEKKEMGKQGQQKAKKKGKGVETKASGCGMKISRFHAHYPWLLLDDVPILQAPISSLTGHVQTISNDVAQA